MRGQLRQHTDRSALSLTKQIGQISPRRHAEVERALGDALAWDELIDQ